MPQVIKFQPMERLKRRIHCKSEPTVSQVSEKRTCATERASLGLVSPVCSCNTSDTEEETPTAGFCRRVVQFNYCPKPSREPTKLPRPACTTPPLTNGFGHEFDDDELDDDEDDDDDVNYQRDNVEPEHADRYRRDLSVFQLSSDEDDEVFLCE